MENLIGLVVENRFKFLRRIGTGSFGVVYLGYDQFNEAHCAIKVEAKQPQCMLNREMIIMQHLQGVNGFPEIIHYGKEKHFSYVVTTLFADNLECLLSKCGGRFSMGTVLNLAIQIINRLEVFHSMNFIHRDIKPENFLISRDDPSLIILIDFGLSKYYRNDDGKHIEFVQKVGMIGTARYVSINAQQCNIFFIYIYGMEQSRRDDLEAVGYMLIYFAKGELPWQNVQAKIREQKYEQILQMKMSVSLNYLCSNLPKCFIHYFQHVKSLLFQQQPNYSLLRSLFEKQLSELTGHTLYDWEYNYKPQKLIDPESIPSVFPQNEIDQVLPVEEEGEAIKVSDQKIKMKFMKQLNEKFEQLNEQQKNETQNTSKLNNYIESELKQEVFTKRKDSKSLTTLKQMQEFKENRKLRTSNDDYDLDVAHDDNDPNLQINNIQVKYY